MTQAILSLSLWFVVFPMLIGVLPAFAFRKSSLRFGSIYLYGFIMILALLQLVAVPYILTFHTFSQFVKLFKILVLSLSSVGFLVLITQIIRKGGSTFLCFPEPKKLKRSNLLTYILFFAILLYQMIMAVVYMMPNGDDAYYVGLALLADSKDAMYTIDPYTGASTALQYRHVLAPLPMYVGLLARESGLHATIIAHTVLPPVLILVSYMLYYKIAWALFDGNMNRISIFMVIMAGIKIFGGTSIYTSEVFFLTRTWQGKSILANLAIPGAFLCMLLLSGKTWQKKRVDDEVRKKNFGIYILLIAMNLVGALASSLGLLLLAFFEMVMAVVIAIRNRRISVLIFTGLCQIPSLIYILLYIKEKGF